MKLYFLIAAFVTLTQGCTTTVPEGRLEFQDASGNIIAIGGLQLPQPIPVNGKTWKGSWQLRSWTAAFPAIATTQGKYVGTVRDEQVSIDLNPGMADDNIVLAAAVTTTVLRGSWYHATLSGPKTMGTFQLDRPLDQSVTFKPQIVYPATSAYIERLTSFKVSPSTAATIAWDRFKMGGSPACVIDDWYLFSKPYKYARIDLRGIYVNGMTGKVEMRESDLSLLKDNSLFSFLKPFSERMPDSLNKARDIRLGGR
jgi:hypothetical protein